MERKKPKIISHKALKQDIRCTCTERDETKAFKRVSLQNEFVSAKFHISIIKALLLAGAGDFAPTIRFAITVSHTLIVVSLYARSNTVFHSLIGASLYAMSIDVFLTLIGASFYARSITICHILVGRSLK